MCECKGGLASFLLSKIIYNFCEICDYKKRFDKKLFFTPPFSGGFLIRDPGSEIRDPGWVKIRIRDKHPGSATLLKTLFLSNPVQFRLCRYSRRTAHIFEAFLCLWMREHRKPFERTSVESEKNRTVLT